MIEEKILKEEELARLLGKDLSTVYRWRTTGGLPFLKAGRQVLIRWSDFLKWCERRAQGKDKPRRRRSVPIRASACSGGHSPSEPVENT